jgi:hypothetical protein
LLSQILNGEWGFDGVVISIGRHDSTSAAAGLDLRMPDRPALDCPRRAVRAGAVGRGRYRTGHRQLGLAARTGRLSRGEAR